MKWVAEVSRSPFFPINIGLGFGATLLEFILYSHQKQNRRTTMKGAVGKGFNEVATSGQFVIKQAA